jgi:hypothetical protein
MFAHDIDRAVYDVVEVERAMDFLRNDSDRISIPDDFTVILVPIEPERLSRLTRFIPILMAAAAAA